MTEKLKTTILKSLEMGSFYSLELAKLIQIKGHSYVGSFNSGIDYRYEK